MVNRFNRTDCWSKARPGDMMVYQEGGTIRRIVRVGEKVGPNKWETWDVYRHSNQALEHSTYFDPVEEGWNFHEVSVVTHILNKYHEV